MNSKVSSSTLICPSKNDAQCANAFVTDMTTYITSPKKTNFDKYLVDNPTTRRNALTKSFVNFLTYLFGPDKWYLNMEVQEFCSSTCRQVNNAGHVVTITYMNIEEDIDDLGFEIATSSQERGKTRTVQCHRPRTVVVFPRLPLGLNGLNRLIGKHYASIQANDQQPLQHIEESYTPAGEGKPYETASPCYFINHSDLKYLFTNVSFEDECRYLCSERPLCTGYAIGKRGGCYVYLPNDRALEYWYKHKNQIETVGTEFDCFKKKLKTNSDILIQKVTQDSIIVSNPSGETELEVPRIFRKPRLFKNVIICLYDTSSPRDDFESACNFIKKTADPSTHVVTKGISDTVDFDFLSDRDAMKQLSANTTYVIYHGHSSQGQIQLLPYKEFAKKLNITFEQTDNGFILLDSCFTGGFADLITERTDETGRILMQHVNKAHEKSSKETNETDGLPSSKESHVWPMKIRMFGSTSGGSNTPAGLRKVTYSRFDGKEMKEIECLPCMMATGIYVFDKSETNRGGRYENVDFDKIPGYQTFGDFERIRERNNSEKSTVGIYVYTGHNVNLNYYAQPKLEKRNRWKNNY